MQEWKASEKEAQKMTRDGAISVNLVTGEATHISDRPRNRTIPLLMKRRDIEPGGGRGGGHVERRQAKKRGRKRATPSGG